MVDCQRGRFPGLEVLSDLGHELGSLTEFTTRHCIELPMFTKKCWNCVHHRRCVYTATFFVRFDICVGSDLFQFGFLYSSTRRRCHLRALPESFCENGLATKGRNRLRRGLFEALPVHEYLNLRRVH
jgi:hypothetical protein